MLLGAEEVEQGVDGQRDGNHVHEQPHAPTIGRAYSDRVPVITYSLLRLGLFGAALVVLWLVGMGGWLLVLVAVVIAFALSYVLLGRQRDAAARWLAE